MKITIEGKRSEGVTTLAVFLNNFLNMLGYKVVIKAQTPDEIRAIKELKPNAINMLTDNKEVEIRTINFEEDNFEED